MASSKDLDVRLEQVEKALGLAKMPDLTDADVAAYHKVRKVLWEGGTCGINETSPCVVVTSVCKICQVCQVCRVCAICRACDTECTCGPCGYGFAQQSGLARFGGLGG